MKFMARDEKGMRALRGYDRGQSGRLLKSIVLPMALTLCGGAQAQSISWLTQDEKVYSGNWYLPVLGSDFIGSFIVVGQGALQRRPI